jgi:hypothetical protein
MSVQLVHREGRAKFENERRILRFLKTGSIKIRFDNFPKVVKSDVIAERIQSRRKGNNDK